MKDILRYTSKRMQKFVKIVHHNLIRQHAILLWFPSGFVREEPDTELQCFLPSTPRFSRQKTLQSLYCGGLQDSALRRDHQSAVHTVE